MEHFVVIRFDTKEKAEAFASEQALEAEIVSKEIYNYGHMHDDVELVMSEYMGLTEKQQLDISVPRVVQELFEYDYSDYNDYIEHLVNQQLEELEEEIK